MYEPHQTEQQLAAFGLTPADFERDTLMVWPDNHQAVVLFSKLATQWRVGMRGCTGLDYGVMFHIMDRMGLAPDEYQHLEDDLRVLEKEALVQMQDAHKES